jgi:hypothetical protein
MTTKHPNIDSMVFVKNLWRILRDNPDRKAIFSSNNGKYEVLLTEHHFDYIVSQRLNHNQFVHQGIVFNLTKEALQLEWGK